jgi:hypothetical protein
LKSKVTLLCTGFIGIYLTALFYALSVYEPSGVVKNFATQLTQVRLPLNLVLLVILAGSVLLKKPKSTILLTAAVYNWILVIDDYFVLQIQSFPFESQLVQVLAALRPFIAAAISLIAFETKMAERGDTS